MCEINDIINKTSFKGLQVRKLIDFNATEILQISLEKDAVFAKHTSPRDATLLVLEGAITFSINNTEYELIKYQLFRFPKNAEHWVKAIANSKFLIIR